MERFGETMSAGRKVNPPIEGSPSTQELRQDTLADSEQVGDPKGPFTRSGVRRAGDDYQDIFALSFFVEMLEHPERYEWVELEADDAGALDDILAKRTDGVLVARQVKFSAYPYKPDDAYDWETLLERSGNRKSLIAKWSGGLEKILARSSNVDARVVSNRRASDNLAAALRGNRVDLPRVDDANIRTRIVEELGGEQQAGDFFSVFQFDLDQPGLDDLEEATFARFLRMGGNEAGWNSLRTAVRRWVRQRRTPLPDGKIRLSDVRAASKWHLPESLPQEFSIPADFVVPSESFHHSLLADLRTDSADWIVLTGSPGSGKSTYCSYLCNTLRSEGIPVVRHHYYLSLDDTTLDRQRHDRVADSLMAALLDELPELHNELQSTNPSHENLGSWLEIAATHMRGRGQSFVVIVDGLDHVWRDQASARELNRLFDAIPQVRGLRLVVGTQRIDQSGLPHKLLEIVPTTQWRELPLMDDDALGLWSIKHGVPAPDLDEYGPSHSFSELVTLLRQKSGGFPLYLQMLIRGLAEQSKELSPENLIDVPECPHEDINLYYTKLWNAISDDCQQIVHLLTACRFPWPRRGIIDCLDPNGTILPQIERGLRQVAHLLRDDGLALEPLHSSLVVFVESLPQHADYSRHLKRKALSWLRERADGSLKWSYLWRMEAEVGNETPLLDGPDRAWLVEALARGRPPTAVNDLLTRAADLALKRGRLGRHVQIGLLKHYYSYALDFRSDSVDAMTYAQLRVSVDLAGDLQSRVSQLGDNSLLALAEWVAKEGRQHAVDAVHHEFRRRHRRLASATTEQHVDDLLGSAQYVVRAAAVSRNTTPDSVVRSVTRIRDRKAVFVLITAYTETLVSERRTDAALQLWVRTCRWPVAARSAVLRHLAPYLFREGIHVADAVPTTNCHMCPVAAVFLAAREPPGIGFSGSLPAPWVLELASYELEKRRDDARLFFHNLFFAFLANSLCGQADDNDTYVKRLPSDRWATSYMAQLADAASAVSSRLSDGQAVDYEFVYLRLSGLGPPPFAPQNDDNGYWLRGAASDALFTIARDLLDVPKSSKLPSVSQESLQQVFETKLCDNESWLRFYVRDRRVWLTNEAADWLLDEQVQKLAARRDEFSERAGLLVELARLAALHDKLELSQTLVRETSANLIAYGDRADSLLHEALESARIIAASGDVATAQAWIKRLAPSIACVREFTDGKGTRHLPESLAGVLAQHKPKWLIAYHRWLVSQEQYYHALKAFGSFVEHTDLHDELNRSAVKTAVDDRSLYALRLRKERGDTYAVECLNTLSWLTPPAEDPDALSSSSGEPEEPSLAAKPELFPPERFTGFLAAVGEASPSTVDDYVDRWARAWVSRGSTAAVLAVLDSQRHRLSSRTHTLRAELTAQLKGDLEAYIALVDAEDASPSWSYYSGRSSARLRWQIVKEYCPARWLEFVRSTLTGSRKWRVTLGTHSTCRKLLEYCVDLNQDEAAKSVGEAIISAVEELVSPLNLRSPKWLDAVDEEYDGLDLLLDRLSWPSGSVRERAAAELASLIADGEPGVGAQDRLLTWLSAQRLESLVCVGLLPFCHARQFGYSPPVDSSVSAAAKPPSILSDLLRIDLGINIGSSPDLTAMYSRTAEPSFEPPPFFQNNNRALVPPILSIEADQLGESFVRQWAYEWVWLHRKLDRPPSIPEVAFWTSTGRRRLLALDLRESEFYRSAFLRALAWAVATRRIKLERAVYHACRLCPINLDLWKVNSCKQPEWWPNVSAQTGAIDTVPSAALGQVRRFWPGYIDGDWVVAASSGVVVVGPRTFEIEIRGVVQACVGSKSPGLSDAFQAAEGTDVISNCRPLRLEGGVSGGEPRERAVECEDWTIQPCSAHLHVSGILRWQWWRSYRGVLAPAEGMPVGDCEVRCTDDAVEYWGEGRCVARWFDWMHHFEELYYPNMPPWTGHVLLIRRSVIEEYQSLSAGTFAWLCRWRNYERKREYGTNVETTEGFSAFGTTSVARIPPRPSSRQ